MSSNLAIIVENVSKCYQIYDAPRDRLKQFILPRWQKVIKQTEKKYYKEFWALKDVCFSVARGETVGIIGRNGCGKSTLLQLICGTLGLTHGRISSYGRVAALLELGSGFNPEFTGRENIFMNASVLGLSRQEIETRFEKIVEFADIGDFIDQPVRMYSSGMAIRLAFAVAINADPDILVVDEALAVGDELFQRKCFSRIEQIKKNGSTVLFVSHSGDTVVSLCDRAILLDSGEKIAEGLPKHIVGHYQKLLYSPEEAREKLRAQIMNNCTFSQKESSCEREDETDTEETYDPNLKPSSTISYEEFGIRIEQPVILTQDGHQVNNLVHGRTYRYRYTVYFNTEAHDVRFGMLIKSITGIELGGAVSAPDVSKSLPAVNGGQCFEVEFSFKTYLNTGTYFMNAGVIGRTEKADGYLHRLVDVAMFRILPQENRYATAIIDFGCEPKIKRIA